MRPLYHPLGHARWRGTHASEEDPPEVVMYTGMQTIIVSCASDWLRIQAPIREWIDWEKSVELSIDRVLRDHIQGSELVTDLWTSAGEV
jgi:hypothetical protein